MSDDVTTAPVIRPRDDADLDALADVLVDVHQSDGYPVEGVDDPRGWLLSPHSLGAWVADLNGHPVGHVQLNEAGDDDAAPRLWHEQSGVPLDRIAVLCRLFVSQQARGHRIGERLAATATQAAEARDRRAVLDVIAKDAAAIATYERLGWRRIGTTEHAVAARDPLTAYCYVAPPAR